ncbi:MAG: SGNH/GDSL hydrolase family protein [Leptospiraceae bacterium]|nr:SGNH/GDSL hydrolase family protein [Leptospiraceae bacterium]
MSTKKKLSGRKKFIFASVAMLLPLLAIEGCSMVFYFVQQGRVVTPPYFGGPPVLSPVPTDTYEFDPLTIWTNNDVEIHKSLVAKKNLRISKKETGEFRVFVVGGSTTANLRKPAGDRISDHIENKLRLDGRKVQVYNMGVPSYTSTNEVYFILSRLIYLEPDLIVVFDGANDAYYGVALKQESWRPNQSDLTIGYHRRMYAFREMRPYERLAYTLNAFLYTPNFIYAMGKRLRSTGSTGSVFSMTEAEYLAYQDESTAARVSVNPVSYANSLGRADYIAVAAQYNEASVQVYVNNVRTMADIAKQQEVAFLHVLQPTALTRQNRSERAQWSVDFNEAYLPGFREQTLRTFNQYSRRLKRVAAVFPEQRIRFLDLSRFTDNLPGNTLFDDYVHVHRDGNLTELIGAEIAREALRMGLR